MTNSTQQVPQIPSLKLKTDTNESDPFTADSKEKYKLSITIELAPGSDPWSQQLGYYGLIQVLVPVGTGPTELCTEASYGSLALQPPQDSGPSPPTGSPLETALVLAPKTVDSDDYITSDKPLTLAIDDITVNSAAGTADVLIAPGWQPATGGPIWQPQGLVYTVVRIKQQEGLDVDPAQWTASGGSSTDMGLGKLTWQTFGDPKSFGVTANGEHLLVATPSNTSKGWWSAQTLLEGGSQKIKVTATDASNNSVTATKVLSLKGVYGPDDSFSRLKVSTHLPALWTPISLVQVDPTQEAILYGAFYQPGSPAKAPQILQNKGSGMQNTWDDTQGPTLQPGYETSPHAYLDGNFYAVFGSATNPNLPQWDVLQHISGEGWKALTRPAELTEQIMGQTVVVFDSKIWVIGGLGASNATYDSVYRLSPGPPTKWETLDPLPRPLSMASAAVCPDISGASKNLYLYLFGGYEAGPLSPSSMRLYKYDEAASPQWSDVGVEFPEGEEPQDPVYWFLGVACGTLYVCVYWDGQSWTYFYDCHKPTQWQHYASVAQQNVSIKPPSAFPYATSTVQRTLSNPTRQILFFVQAVGDISSSTFQSTFAAFEPSCSQQTRNKS